jgi:hypothetical protein
MAPRMLPKMLRFRSSLKYIKGRDCTSLACSASRSRYSKEWSPEAYIPYSLANSKFACQCSDEASAIINGCMPVLTSSVVSLTKLKLRRSCTNLAEAIGAHVEKASAPQAYACKISVSTLKSCLFVPLAHLCQRRGNCASS